MTTGGACAERMIVNGGLGIVIQAGNYTGAADGITAARYFQVVDSYEFNNWGYWRPESASLPADEWRLATTVASAKLSVNSNWADTTFTDEEIYVIGPGAIHPQFIWDAENEALRDLYFPNIEPLSHKPLGTGVADAGFQSSGTGSYTTGSSSFSKVTTANSNNVRTGVGSGRVQNSGANGHIYQAFDAVAGQKMRVFACGRIDSGTAASVVLYDGTGSAAVGTTITHSQKAFCYIKREETVPASSVVMQVRLGGTGASDDTYWDAQHVYFEDVAYFPLDSTWQVDEFRAPKLMYLRFRGQEVSSDVWVAGESDLHEVPEEDYSLHKSDQEAHPYAIQFHNGSHLKWYQYPLFIQGRRAHSDIAGKLDNSDWTTDVKIDLPLWESRARVALFTDRRVQREYPDWPARLNDAQEDFRRASRRFTVKGPAASGEPFYFAGLRG